MLAAGKFGSCIFKQRPFNQDLCGGEYRVVMAMNGKLLRIMTDLKVVWIVAGHTRFPACWIV